MGSLEIMPALILNNLFTQCHDNHHNWEELLEEWWAIKPVAAEEMPALKQWLCDDKLQVCCPEGTFGPDCSPCKIVDDQESVPCAATMAHRKWKETKQQPGTAGPGNMLGSCLVSFHFLWAILCTNHSKGNITVLTG